MYDDPPEYDPYAMDEPLDELTEDLAVIRRQAEQRQIEEEWPALIAGRREDGPRVNDLASWLLEHIAEDERIAEEWRGEPLISRVLAECEAKRRIVETLDIAERNFQGVHRAAADYARVELAMALRDALLYAVQLLALPYADRPGYQEAWRP